MYEIHLLQMINLFLENMIIPFSKTENLDKQYKSLWIVVILLPKLSVCLTRLSKKYLLIILKIMLQKC